MQSTNIVRDIRYSYYSQATREMRIYDEEVMSKGVIAFQHCQTHISGRDVELLRNTSFHFNIDCVDYAHVGVII